MNIVSRAELERHKHEGDCWIAIYGLVYDVTQYLPDHPGGGELISILGGRDVTKEFEEEDHSAQSRKERKIVLKGILEGCEEQVANLRARGWKEKKGIPYPALLSDEPIEEVPEASKENASPAGRVPFLAAAGITALAVVVAILRLRRA
eukprot:TRINITY_DN34384_c0_g2_i1.p1 TRINITY_DN34384_c0_g2~~TRINITY_DN34384_c0_g2_i1.p1  ORF type:complete len:149 (-),score=32.31 TRINITY_DN34384_c0_g2_i1:433-879(-)